MRSVPVCSEEILSRILRKTSHNKFASILMFTYFLYWSASLCAYWLLPSENASWLCNVPKCRLYYLVLNSLTRLFLTTGSWILIDLIHLIWNLKTPTRLLCLLYNEVIFNQFLFFSSTVCRVYLLKGCIAALRWEYIDLPRKNRD